MNPTVVSFTATDIDQAHIAQCDDGPEIAGFLGKFFTEGRDAYRLAHLIEALVEDSPTDTVSIEVDEWRIDARRLLPVEEILDVELTLTEQALGLPPMPDIAPVMRPVGDHEDEAA